MKRILLAGLLLAVSIAAAHAFGLGLGSRIGRLGAVSGGAFVAGPNGKILLVDGVSFILQTDAASKICRAGGC